MHLIFKNKTIADTLLKEICVTPFDGIILWAVYKDPAFWFAKLNEDGSVPDEIDEGANLVSYITSTDGRCAIAHPFSESDVGWLEAYLDTQIKAGEVVIAEKFPTDWKYPQES